MEPVKFTEMKYGTKEEYLSLLPLWGKVTQQLPEQLLSALDQLKHSYEGFQVNRYEHSLQAATRAHRNGEKKEMVVAALFHDIGDFLAPYNHGEMAAAILKPYVSEKTHWIIKHHDVFQKYYYAHHLGGDRYEREQYRDSPYYQATIDFCENYDQNSIDPKYKSLPIEFFVPIVKQVFAQPPSS
ncbi:MAG: HD domain-containing protein [Cyanobacteria bacterium P01_B01_bin.77]